MNGRCSRIRTATRGLGGLLLTSAVLSTSGCGGDVVDDSTASDAMSSAESTAPLDTEIEEVEEVRAPEPPSDAELLENWWSSDGMASFMTIAEDAGNISVAANSFDVPGLIEACEALQGHVEDAQASSPAPVAAVRVPLVEALALYARAASDCIAGGSTYNGDLLQKSAEEIVQATAKIEEATAAVNAVSGG